MALIDDCGERTRLARAARACVDSGVGALDRTLDVLDPYLTPLAGR
jgi:hypothetical protein